MEKIILLGLHVLFCITTSAQIIFDDGFESGSYSPIWVNDGGSYSKTVVSTGSIEGAYNLEMNGSDLSHFSGLSTYFTVSQPNKISWYVKTNSITSASGYVVIGPQFMTGLNSLVFSYIGTSKLWFSQATGMPTFSTPISNNTWYFIELKDINWTTRTYDLYINNVLQMSSYPFRDQNVDNVCKIALYNYNGGVISNFDKIVIEKYCISTDSTINTMECNSYTVPSGDETYTTSGTYTDTIPNSIGCDSIITINLTIGSFALDTIITSCGEFIIYGNTYDSTGIYIDTITNGIGCDTIVTLHATINEIPETSEIFGNPNPAPYSIWTYMVTNTQGSSYEWIVEGGAISSYNGNAIDVLWGANGIGSICVIETNETGCVGDTICLDDVQVFIQEEALIGNISFYPNPVYDFFSFDYSGNYDIVTFELFDLQGRKLIRKELNYDDRISLRNLNSGMYLYNIVIDGKLHCGKIIKN
ncbi:MAG: T9SS type A sorting domain-containing protein [Bacteroidetes bacterium]|nr:T9SS type A sorting domain-containing protein [Bacteroidota bacterium]MBU1720672.1 T9SS type A sorting domain-containing protein [Bacteroidota bacterium]